MFVVFSRRLEIHVKRNVATRSAYVSSLLSEGRSTLFIVLHRIAALAIEVAYWYRQSNFVGLSVGLSVGHNRDPCKNPCKTIKVPFGMMTRLGQRTRVLEGVHIGATWQIRLNIQLYQV